MKKELNNMNNNILEIARENDNTIKAVRFENKQWLGADFSSLEMEYVIFDHCRFDDCDFYSANFYKTEFIQCDFSNCRFQKSYWNYSKIHSSKGIGASFTESVFKHCSIIQSQFPYANFPKSAFDHTDFRESSFLNASFHSCIFKKTSMKDVILSKAEFFHAQMGCMDLSECAIDAIVVSSSLQELKGVKINPGQAVDLISLLGVQLI